MTVFLYPTLVLLLLLVASSMALPPRQQHYLTTQDNTPTWANEASPASIHHNIHPDEALPVAEAALSVATDFDQTIDLPSAPTSSLPLLQRDW
ncbi:hypothetical protein PV08_05375 [Exophiala spinifera]|uniref:Uncharacterized protein n=1 Tax=Exophiala spinifera TaxID=91928 RepID=A0A0D2BVL6_9EURO|nr:uncharacterized protein PV08_05375 [Exophiala spinifera]KIW15329.1 hypothetical protein PV08_05375 [Exophiala spinifera]